MGFQDQFPERGMKEVFQKSSSQKMDDHLAMIKKFLANGYKIQSQDETSESGLDGELIESRLVTVLEPVDHSGPLPLIKFDARQIFGRYFWEESRFEPWEEPSFQADAYRKSADIRRRDAAWEPFDQ